MQTHTVIEELETFNQMIYVAVNRLTKLNNKQKGNNVMERPSQSKTFKKKRIT